MRAPPPRRVAARGIGRPTPLCGGAAVCAAAHMRSHCCHAVACSARSRRSYKRRVVLDGERRCRRLCRRLQRSLRVPAAAAAGAASLRPRLPHPAPNAGYRMASPCDDLSSR